MEPVLGDLILGPAGRLPCIGTMLEPGYTESADFRKSGGWTSEDPLADEYESFFRDPELRLTQGTWHVYTVADFSIGECGPNPIEMRADLTIEVVGRLAPIESPTPSQEDPSIEPIRSIDRSGGFQLALAARPQYVEGEGIDAVVSLENIRFEKAPFVLAQSPLVSLSVIDVGGSRHAEFEGDGCGPLGIYEIGVPNEMPYVLRRSYGTTASPESFYDVVVGDMLRLPAGTWRLVAATRLWGAECDASNTIELEVEVTIFVE